MNRYNPLPVPIPSEFARILGVDSSIIYHVNAGRKRLGLVHCLRLLELAAYDSRLEGLTLLHLRQELAPALPYLCKMCPRDRKKNTKKRSRRGQQ
jgi:hypothetical protein